MSRVERHFVTRVTIERTRIAVDLDRDYKDMAESSLFERSRILLPLEAKEKINVGDNLKIIYFSEGQIGDIVANITRVGDDYGEIDEEEEIPIFSDQDPRVRKKPPCWEDFIDILRLNRFKVCGYKEHQGMESEDFYVEITVYHMDTSAIPDITGKGRWEEDAIQEVLRKIENKEYHRATI